MQKITTYKPNHSRPAFTFYILNKGMNSGKPLENPCPNCFAFQAKDQEEMDHFFWLSYGLWQSGTMHQYLAGSVIPFIHLRDLKNAINHASDIAKANPESFLKTIKALKILDQHEKQYHRNLILIKEAKKAIFANYRNRPSFYR